MTDDIARRNVLAALAALSTIDITATHHEDGEPSNVEVQTYNDTMTLSLGLSPERAREVAADLQLAASHAENGGVDN